MNNFQKSCAIFFTAFFFFSSCGDDFSQEVEDDLSSLFTFAKTPDENSASVSRRYKIGDTISNADISDAVSKGEALPSSAFPDATDSEIAAWNTGYNVAGWKFYKNSETKSTAVPKTVQTNDDGSVQSMTVTPQNITFYVSNWTPITYKLILDAGFTKQYDDEVAGQVPIILTYDTSKTLPENTFARNAYDFKGWAKEKDSTVKEYDNKASVLNLATSQGEQVFLYPVWIKQGITVKFEGGGGSGSMPDQNYKFDDAPITLPANAFTNTGFDFSHWLSDNGKSYVDGEQLVQANWPNKDVTLSAQWRKIQYTVNFYPNDGTNAMNSQTFDYGEAQNLSANAFSRIGYDWNGWKDSAGKSYSDAQSVTLPADAPSIVSATANDYTRRTLELKAQWNPQVFTLSFDSNGGSGTMSSQSLTFSDSISETISPNQFSRTGYNFQGWSVSSSAASAEFSDKQAITSANWANLYANQKLYAVWSSRAVLNESASTAGASAYFSADEKITFRADSADSYQWNINGTNIGTSQTLELSYGNSNIKIGENSVTLLSFKDGRPIFREFVFTVSAAY